MRHNLRFHRTRTRSRCETAMITLAEHYADRDQTSACFCLHCYHTCRPCMPIEQLGTPSQDSNSLNHEAIGCDPSKPEHTAKVDRVERVPMLLLTVCTSPSAPIPSKPPPHTHRSGSLRSLTCCSAVYHADHGELRLARRIDTAHKGHTAHGIPLPITNPL